MEKTDFTFKPLDSKNWKDLERLFVPTKRYPSGEQLISSAVHKSPVNPWIAYAAAAWAFVFAVFHLIWAAGWYVGLNAEQSQKIFAKPLFLAYDLVIAVMCLIAIPVALAFVQPWGRAFPRKFFGAIAWCGTSLLVLRAVASFVQTMYLVSTGQFNEEPRSVMWELWFYLGAALWGMSVGRFSLRKGS